MRAVDLAPAGIARLGRDVCVAGMVVPELRNQLLTRCRCPGKVGADILVHNENLFGAGSMLHPYFGVGISYLDEELPLRLREDGFTWNIFSGAKITIQPTISAHVGGQFWGLWSEFGENDFTIDTGLSWLIDYQNGVSVDYQYSLEHEVSYLTLKYLYSWQ